MCLRGFQCFDVNLCRRWRQKDGKWINCLAHNFSGATHFAQGNIHAHISTLEMTFLTAKHELLSQLQLTVTRAQTE